MTINKKQIAYDKGVQAEKISAQYLRRKGYIILEERYKTKYGEIDIIAAKDEYIVAIEVKARTTIEAALEAITPRTQRRIEQAMLYYISQNPHHAMAAIRFDAIAFSPPLSIHHLDNAWRPEA